MIEVEEFELIIEDKKDTNHIVPHTHFFKYLNREIRLSPKTEWLVGVKLLQLTGPVQETCTAAVLLPSLIPDPYVADIFHVVSGKNYYYLHPEWIKFFPVKKPYFSSVEIRLNNQSTKQTLASSEASNSLLHTILVLKFKPMDRREYTYHFCSKNDNHPSNKANHFRVSMAQDLQFHQRQSWKMSLVLLKWPSIPQTSVEDLDNAFKLSVFKVKPNPVREPEDDEPEVDEPEVGEPEVDAPEGDFWFEDEFEDALEELEQGEPENIWEKEAEIQEWMDNLLKESDWEGNHGRLLRDNEDADEDNFEFLEEPLKEWTFILDYRMSERDVLRDLNTRLNEINTDDVYARFKLTKDRKFSFDSRGLILHVNRPLGLCLGLGDGGLLIDKMVEKSTQYELFIRSEPIPNNTFPQKMDLKRTRPNVLLVKCDAVRDAEGGDKLALVPVTNMKNKQFETRHPNYVDIDVNRLSHMEFTLTNVEGKPIVFTSDKPCYMTIHIKRFY